jgi:hypothetical protein
LDHREPELAQRTIRAFVSGLARAAARRLSRQHIRTWLVADHECSSGRHDGGGRFFGYVVQCEMRVRASWSSELVCIQLRREAEGREGSMSPLHSLQV